MAHAEKQSKIEKLLAEEFEPEGACAGLCDELENISGLLDNATGKQRAALLARLRAVEAQRTAMHCLPCLFQ